MHLHEVIAFILFSQHKKYQNLLIIKIKFSKIYWLKLKEILTLCFSPDCQAPKFFKIQWYGQKCLEDYALHSDSYRRKISEVVVVVE